MKAQLNEDPVLLAVAILDDDKGNSFVKKAIEFGLSGGLVTPALGLIRSEILNLLSIRSRRKDAVILFERESNMIPALKQLSEHFQMDKPNHGIIFVLQVQHAITRFFDFTDNDFDKSQHPYQLLWLTFKHGRHLEILKTLNKMDQRGATFFTGRGEFVHERQQVLGMKLVPQKDTLLSVIPQNNIERIVHGLEEEFAIESTRGMKLVTLNVDAFSKAPNPTDIHLSESRRSMLVSIVSEDLQEEYIEVVKHLNMSGGTSINGYGALSQETIHKLFNISVSPQKKILLTVDYTDKINEAYQAIINDEILQTPHKGIYFTIPVYQAFGLYNPE